MKKIIKSLTAFFIMASLITATFFAAGAAGYTNKAEALNRMNLFLGTEIGFELDRVPTRAEAAVMLVRLLGQEQNAQNGAYHHPFKDVPAWVDPYVGYLYEHGLTKGTEPTTFEPETDCSAQMYTTFVLRSLGYTEENGSFTYERAQSFAEELGLMYYDDSADFLRDNMVAISYSALFQNERNSTQLLIEKLIADGAVTSESASTELHYFQVYTDYLAACRASGLEDSNLLTTSTYVEFSLNQQPLNYRQITEAKTVMDGNTFTYSSDSNIYGSESARIQNYYADGWLYLKSGDEKYKMRVDLDKNDYAPEDNLGVQPFYNVKSMYKTDDGTHYTAIYEPGASSSLLETFAPYLSGLYGPQNVLKGGLRADTYFEPDGTLKSQTMSEHVSSTNTDEYYALEVDLSGEIYLAATGDEVQITLPDDLDTYVDIGSLDN